MANSVVVNFTHRKALQYKWAKISILWLQDSLLEHEVAMPRRLQEHKEARAFWALAQGCNAFQIDASIKALQYTNSDCISATLKVVLKENCPDEIAYSLLQYAFLSPPAPLHYTLEQFYQHLQPPVLQHIASSYISSDLRPQLLPFQSQNVQWLLNREGHYVNDNGQVTPLEVDYSKTEAFIWEKIELDKQELYINRASEQVSVGVNSDLQYARTLVYRGGILSDEMGLGKTVSMLALILLHRRTFPPTKDENGLIQSGATLIITPSTISHQWEAEIRLHAPTLSYTYYQGIKDKSEKQTTPEKLASYDIVLTNYDVLSREIWYARDHNERSRRSAPRYPPRKSPLVKVKWWRCLLDEAQMVESTVAATAEMARLIPRHYSWAVTGTPMSTGYNDLYGLFLFLGIIPSCSTPAPFTSLYQNPDLFYQFLDLTARVVRRNAKKKVQDQVIIPVQRRKMVHISFSQFEQHYYDDLWSQCCRSTDLEWLEANNWGEGENLTTGQKSRVNQMMTELRNWLLTLRQTCVHPGVGIRNQRQLGSVVHTLPEVLEVMINQSKDKIKEAESGYSATCLRHAGMHEILEEWQLALNIYLDGVKFNEARVDEARKDVEDSKAEAAEERNADGSAPIPEVEVKSADSEKKQNALSIARNRLSNCLLLLHRFLFYAAGMYHELKDEDNESKLYDRAEELRRELLRQSQNKFKSTTQELDEGFKAILSHKALEFQVSEHNTGILSWQILEDIEDVAEKLDAQMNLIVDWRQKIYEYLTLSLETEDEAKGDEYETSLVVQESGMIYLDTYQMLLKDHDFYLTGSWNALYLNDNASRPEREIDESTRTEQLDKLEKDLKAERAELAAKSAAENNIRVLQNALRDVGQRSYVNVEESAILKLVLNQLRKETERHKTILEKLENEARKFSQLYNARIEYYRALQHISDQVKAWESKDPKAEIEELKEQERKYQREAAAQTARSRYLTNLSKEETQSDANQTHREFDNCLICQSEFDRGIITYCAHMFCEDCANRWFETSRRCPTCSATVEKKQWWTVAWNKPMSADTAIEQIEYSGDAEELLPASTFSNILSMPIKGGLGAKLDTIIKHIKYIKQTDEEGKCVIFSQWRTVLDILAGGLRRNNIGYVEFGKAKNQQQSVLQFRNDPNISVILLNARTQSSGLTLVAAQTVFMVEPVFNEALEQQAISRVDRIGQTKETTVFWYIVRDTIEERVHEIHNAKRHYRNEFAKEAQESANSRKAEVLPLHATLDKLSAGGGEVVSDEDLHNCFTKHLRPSDMC
ncbi:unnamed protein product [Umbelopsis ramanniana]